MRRKSSLASKKRTLFPQSVVLLLSIVVGIIIIIITWNEYFKNPSPTNTPEPTPTNVSEPTIQPSPTNTPDPTVPPTTTPTNIPEPTTQPTPRNTPGPTPTNVSEPTTALGTINISGLSNEKKGWWYTPGGSPGTPASIPSSISTLLSKYDGVWQGNTESKKIYITMDVGYEYNNNTTRILDIAKDKNFKINFFITGTILKDNNLKQLAVRMKDEGHLVGNHSYNHPSFPVLLSEKGVQPVIDEMKSVADAYLSLTGVEIAPFMRPPMGEYSEATTYIMQQLGYKSVFWSFAYRDWLTADQPKESDALKRIVDNLHNGSVLLLHTVSNTNVNILSDLIDIIRERGYEISLLSEMD